MNSAHRGDDQPGGYDLQRELRSYGWAFRVLFVLYALGGAVGGLFGGFMLLHETNHWIPWTIALAIVEPTGAACALALLVLIAPDSIFATFLAGAIRRAVFGALVLGAAFFLFVVGALSYGAWYFVTER